MPRVQGQLVSKGKCNFSVECKHTLTRRVQTYQLNNMPFEHDLDADMSREETFTHLELLMWPWYFGHS